MIELHLFLTFCKFSLLCFGGGYMLIPLLTDAYVGDGKLLTPEKFGNLVSISQLTPGPVGINTATYVGFLQGSFTGSLAATLGLVFPTLILAGAAISFINANKDKKLLQGILYGARVGAAALIVFAVLIFAQMSMLAKPLKWGEMPQFSISGILITLVCFVLAAKFKWKTTWIILLAGVAGAVLIPLIG